MKIIHILILAQMFVLYCECSGKESNKLTSASKNLDSNLRKALLKALTELEADSSGSKSITGDNNIVEKASASAISVYQSNTDNDKNNTQQLPQQEKQIVVVQKSNGLQHKPITTFIPGNITEQFVTSASSNFHGAPQSRVTRLNSIPTTEKSKNLIQPSPTAETPTTEESEAKVEDVQFFSAPLVAAFTVHQDERGLPKSVEPIYKSTTSVPKVTNFAENRYNIQQEIFRRQQLKTEQLRTQIALQEKQKILEEQLISLQRAQKEQQQFLYKQQQLIREQERKLLEERERNRNRQNDQPFVPIISNNHNYQSQIESKNRFSTHESDQISSTTPVIHNHIESANRLPIYSSHQITATAPIHNHIEAASTVTPPSSQLNPPNSIRSTVVFQPSVSLSPAAYVNNPSELPLNAQQLPTKNFIDFRQTPYHQNSIDSLTNQIQPLLPPHQTTYNNVNYVPSLDITPHQNIRTYRQEPSPQHFYNNYNLYTRNAMHSIQPSIPLNVRYYRNNVEGYQTAAGFPAQQPVVKQQLSNLLYNSGINTGRHEDLDLISKVLSYNHMGANTRYYTPIH
ncbi:hypothetical protein Trydic_g1215 [Trypoxylus dichotomus]